MHRDTALHRVAGGGDLTGSTRHPDRDREVERRFEYGNSAARRAAASGDHLGRTRWSLPQLTPIPPMRPPLSPAGRRLSGGRRRPMANHQLPVARPRRPPPAVSMPPGGAAEPLLPFAAAQDAPVR